MKDRVFLDTNILVYAHTDMDTLKQEIAQNLILNNNTVLSTQVLQETANTLKRKFSKPWSEISIVLNEAREFSNLHLNVGSTILAACRLADLYKFSFYDSLIISSALESGCVILYSEDLHNGQIIEQTLRIENPFLKYPQN